MCAGVLFTAAWIITVVMRVNFFLSGSFVSVVQPMMCACSRLRIHLCCGLFVLRVASVLFFTFYGE